MPGVNLTSGLGAAGPMVTGGLAGNGSAGATGPGQLLTGGLGFGGLLVAAGLGSGAGSDSGALPADLDAAIAARFAADATLPGLATGGIFNGVAADTATMPYLVFKVSGGTPAYSSAGSRWLDQRVRFECFAPTVAAANAMARAVVAAYGSPDSSAGVPFSYEAGVTTAPVLDAVGEVVERPRGKDNARVHRSAVSYSIRARIGRPT